LASKPPRKQQPETETVSPIWPLTVEPLSGSTDRNYAAIAHEYARAVVAGEIPACKWVKLACQRDIDDRAKLDFAYVFDADAAAHACSFIEFLPHTKGDWAKRREQIVLEPWQCFGLCAIFGWLDRETRLRRYREAYWNVPRKNGKSLLAGGVGNYMLAADGEFGAEVYTGATSEKQDFEVFKPARLMIDRSPRVKELFGIRVGRKNLSIAATGSLFEPLIGNPGDGASPSCAIVDEYHQYRTDALVDTMRTGMGARSQPLLFIITTAGSNIAGPCHSFQRDAERVLDGSIERDELFAAIYTCDESDDWTSEAALRKANPNYGVSVLPRFLADQQKAAVQSARKQNIFKTKHLNMWVGANVSWLNLQQWKAQGDPLLKPAQFRGEPCFGASDLSSKLDLTASVKVFRKTIDKKQHYFVFGRYYVPAQLTLEPELERYAGWAHDGFLTTTPGAVIDYQTISDEAEADIKEFKICEWAFDPWNAEQFAQGLVKKTRVTAVEVPQQVRCLSEPMKQLEALVVAGRLHHDGNPVLEWMIGNVVAHVDAKDNVFPNREKPESKIDGAVALIMALSRALVSAPKVSVYSTRGVLTL